MKLINLVTVFVIELVLAESACHFGSASCKDLKKA